MVMVKTRKRSASLNIIAPRAQLDAQIASTGMHSITQLQLAGAGYRQLPSSILASLIIDLLCSRVYVKPQRVETRKNIKRLSIRVYVKPQCAETRKTFNLLIFSCLGERSHAIDTNSREIVADSYLGERYSRIRYEVICNNNEFVWNIN